MDLEEQKLLLKIVQTWHPNEFPEYRGFRCANCQRYINEAWHHWLTTGGFRIPVHLCRDCEPEFQSGSISIDETKVSQFDISSFGNAFQFADSTRTRFIEIINAWTLLAAPVFKPFVCDECGKELEIDPADSQRKGFHVWWRADNQTLAELHFHRSCGEKLGIE